MRKNSQEEHILLPQIFDTDRRAALTIAHVWEIGSRSLRRIRNAFPSLHAFLNDTASWDRLGLNVRQKLALKKSVSEGVDDLIRLLERYDIRFLLPGDKEFPHLLGNIDNAPEALFVRGGVLNEDIKIAVIGTRKLTSYGRRSAEFFASELARNNIVVVSGLALGIDAAAHRGSLDAGGVTIAVLPGGVDDASIAPASHVPLAHEILRCGGTLVSEHPPGTPTLPYHYLERNRLISGLGAAAVIVEADHGSGALTTARYALEQGREVLAVPGSIWSEQSRGTNKLITDGARPCLSLQDIFEALGQNDDKGIQAIAEVRNALPLSDEEKAILLAMTDAMSVDEIARKTSFGTAKSNAIVSLLELKGYILSVGPKTYSKASMRAARH